MIKLTRPIKPAYLTPAKELELVAKFKKTGDSVWKHRDIADALLKSSHGKCAYCECSLQVKDSYMEVEHFLYKSDYPDKVVDWENLLPSCRRCNTSKSIHDVLKDAIVNPYRVKPSEHLYLEVAYFRSRDKLGLTTIDVLDLNSPDKLAIPRFRITLQLEANLDAIQNALTLYIADKTTRRKNKFTSIFKGTLRECQPSTEFSATAATFIHQNSRYSFLRSSAIKEAVWDNELEELHTNSLRIRLDK